ncbi:MAG: galactose-1-phosphate uridylyltransferase [Lentisphaeria bacterium]|nr:galactose-1-phosphate uridylyltransferase [Lentisphaeria bacterium]
MQNEFKGWEQRWHPLREEWIVYAAHRNQRPWDGANEKKETTAKSYDEKCYLCPGNKRVSGEMNPNYSDVFIFDNDHPVVGPLAPDVCSSEAGLYKKKAAKGIARVICYNPHHSINLSQLELAAVTKVVKAWKDQTLDLGEREDINYVLIFENKGEIVGTSSPHPHCQVYATNFPFQHTVQELKAVESYKKETKRNLFDDILQEELNDGSRIICENDHAVVILPYFARYAYECWIFPKRRCSSMSELTEEEVEAIADMYRELIRRYDALYDMPFPYVMSIYQAPTDGKNYDDYHLHLVFLPPLRQPGIKKFPAGPEIGGGNFMSDTLPEEKALELQNINLEEIS